MNERLLQRVHALMHGPEEHTISESEMVAALYSTVTQLNEQIAEARTHQIEVTLDVEYIRMLDASRPHDVIISLKVAKLLNVPAIR